MEAVGHLIEHFPELKIRLQTFISTGKRLSSWKRADVLSFVKDHTTTGKRNMRLQATQHFTSAVAKMVHSHGHGSPSTSPKSVSSHDHGSPSTTETGSFESAAIDSTDKSQDATARSNASSVETVRFVKLERKFDELRNDMQRKARWR